MDNGMRYSPDWIVHQVNGRILCVEVKNTGYKHAAYGRARLAFKQTSLDWPQFDWRWSEKTKDGWDEKRF